MTKLPKFLKLKGVIESNDGGETWVIARTDYFAGCKDKSGKEEFFAVPSNWKTGQLIFGAC